HVTPKEGCPGESITLTGKNFPATGKLTALFTAHVFPFFTAEPATVMRSTSATSVVPIFLTVTSSDEMGHVRLAARGDDDQGEVSQALTFSFTKLATCFGG